MPILQLDKDESNALKGIALVLLLIHHLFYIKTGQYDDITIHGHNLVNSIGLISKVCVAIFVFLSGYGLGTNITISKKLNIKNFYFKRYTKLFLNYWLIWIIFVPIGIIFFNRNFEYVYGKQNELIYLILDLTGLINLTGKLGYNPTWWFYSCIILLYLIFPLIDISIRRFPKSIFIYLLLGIIIVKLDITFIQPIRYYLLPYVLGILFSNEILGQYITPPHFTTH